jgi:hypothetical protein
LTSKIDIKVQEASPGAIEAIERLGGSIECVYKSPREIESEIHPERFIIPPTEKMDPTEWRDLRHYINADKRGYLAPGEGETIESVVERVLSRTRKVGKAV